MHITVFEWGALEVRRAHMISEAAALARAAS